MNRNGSLLGQQLLVGHPFTTPVYRWILRSLSSCDFEVVPEMVLSYLHMWWGSLLNSKLVEDANQLQRTEELRCVASKRVSCQQGWYTLTQHQLLRKNERTEVQAQSDVRMEADFNFEALFRFTQKREMDVEESADFRFLQDITKDITWPSFTPASAQECLSNFALLGKICQEEPVDWGKVESSQWASFLPPGHVIVQQGCPALVLRAYRRACLVWPLERGPLRSVKFLNVASLSWAFCFDVAEVQIETVTARSPLAMMGTELENHGIVLETGTSTGLWEWHVEHGFPGVREDALRFLCAKYGIDLSEEQGEDAELHLVVRCMLHFDPTLTQAEVTERVLQRAELQVETLETTEAEISEAVQDTLLPGEQRKAVSGPNKGFVGTCKNALLNLPFIACQSNLFLTGRRHSDYTCGKAKGQWCCDQTS